LQLYTFVAVRSVRHVVACETHRERKAEGDSREYARLFRLALAKGTIIPLISMPQRQPIPPPVPVKPAFDRKASTALSCVAVEYAQLSRLALAKGTMNLRNVNLDPIDVPMAFNLPDQILLADHIILGAGPSPSGTAECVPHDG
jgi:hypothetical protein